MKSMICMLMLLCLLLPCAAKAFEAPYSEDMAEATLLSVGNTERLHRAMDKARSGEEVVIAYLGGSITEGEGARPKATQCYANLSARAFAARYMPDAQKLRYVNAGISGTPSLLGITRVQKDVLSKKPDIVFIEFAVNDGADLVSRNTFESLVRKVLGSETQPAVILVFTLTRGGHSCQPHMQRIGEYYDLGMISVRDAVQLGMKSETFAWADYSADDAHPNTAGHAFIAECIDRYFAAAEQAAPQAYAVPEKPLFSNALEGLTNLAKNDPAIVSEGAFPHGPVSCYSYRQGWRHLAAKGGTEALNLRLTCSQLTIVFKQENNRRNGNVEVYVDGVKKKTLAGHSTSAWGNPVTVLIDLGKSAEHVIEFRPAEGDENKNFYLLDIGYVP